MPSQALIIDDDEVLGGFVAEVARHQGFSVRQTTTAEDFLDALTPDVQLVLLDLVIPRVDGVELLRALRDRQSTASVILMSGLGTRIMESAEDLAGALGINIVGHLAKPFRRTDLEAMLQQFLATMEVAGQCGQRDVTHTDPSEISFADLDAGLLRHEFIPYFQPQIDLRTGALVGVEALVRWNHPRLGLLPPASFLPELEKADLMDRLNWEVISLTLAALQRFEQIADRRPGASINIPVSSLRDLSFPDTLSALLHRYHVSADRIVLEITEGGLLEDLASALDVLTRLRMKGIRLSIDDFGTGYAMMQQLQRIPATELKIDRSFVARLGRNSSDRVMVQKTIEMGHGLGLRVVAEGVETEEQLALLRQDGCDFAQGFLFSRPVPEHELHGWLMTYAAA